MEIIDGKPEYRGAMVRVVFFSINYLFIKNCSCLPSNFRLFMILFLLQSS